MRSSPGQVRSTAKRLPERALAAGILLLAQGCAGSPIQVPRRDSDTRFDVPPDLASAEARWRADPKNEDAIIWYGRRTAYEGRYDDALAIFTEGLRHHPESAQLLRHRGHRYLSVRRYADARRDLERAARLVEGTADQVELDGAPNEYGIPRSTLHTNIWYHLGLAYHLLGQDERAAAAFARCLAISTNDDYRVAAAYWRAIALFHLGRANEALALAELYANRDLELMESFDYAYLVRLFAGASNEALAKLQAAETAAARGTLTYGVATWHRMNGRDNEARSLLEELVSLPDAASFGRRAAEVELERMRNQDG